MEYGHDDGMGEKTRFFVAIEILFSPQNSKQATQPIASIQSCDSQETPIYRQGEDLTTRFHHLLHLPSSAGSSFKSFNLVMQRMGDHFVLLVDRLLTESSLEAAIEGIKISSSSKEEMGTDVSAHRMDLSFESLPKKFAECRICHDEDEDSNMETPCACCGSLKYAHRRCVQRWCNEKGNTICEICLKPFKPDYTSPPPLFHCHDGTPMSFRGNWEISRRDLYNLRFSAMGPANHDEPDFDEYMPSSRSLICCRVVAIIFMTLLVLRHTLPIIINGTGGYAVTLFTLVMLRCIGVLLPIYIMDHVYPPSDEENNLPQSQTRLHVVPVH